MLSIDWVGLHDVKFLKEKLQAQVEGVKGLSTEDFFFYFRSCEVNDIPHSVMS